MYQYLCAALEMVEQELPVVPDMSIAHDAQILLDACQSVGLIEWSIALALALENTLVLSGIPLGRTISATQLNSITRETTCSIGPWAIHTGVRAASITGNTAQAP